MMSSIGSAAATLARGRTPARSRVTKETSASGSAPGCIVGRHAVGAGQRQHLLRVEGRHARGKFGARHRQVGGHAHDRAHAHDFAVADLGGAADRAAPGARRWFRWPAAAGRSCGWRACRRSRRWRRAASSRPAPAPWRNWFRRRATQKRRRPSGPRRRRRSGSCRKTTAPKRGGDRSRRRCRHRPKAAARCRDRWPDPALRSVWRAACRDPIGRPPALTSRARVSAARWPLPARSQMPLRFAR